MSAIKSSADPTFPARFFARSVPGPNGCLNWTGMVNNHGRGWLKFDCHYTTAQRVAWQIAHGPIPEGMFVAHTCRNPRCIRIAHLTLMTRAELTARYRADLSQLQARL